MKHYAAILGTLILGLAAPAAHAGSLALIVTIGTEQTEFGIDIPDEDLAAVVSSHREKLGMGATADAPAASDEAVIHAIVREMVAKLRSDDAAQRQRIAAEAARETAQPFSATPRDPVRRTVPAR